MSNRSIFDRFKLSKPRVSGGEETHRFDATLILVKTSGEEVRIAHVSNGGTGGSNLYHALAPITNNWIYEELEPRVQRLLIEHYEANPNHSYPNLTAKQSIELLRRSKECLDWLVDALIDRNYKQLEQTKRDEVTP